jgi:hypothetical protein
MLQDKKEKLIYFLRYYYHDAEFVHFNNLLQKLSLTELELKLEQPFLTGINNETLENKYQYLNDNFILLVRDISKESQHFDFNVSYLMNLNNKKLVILSDNYHNQNSNLLLLALTHENTTMFIESLQENSNNREWNYFKPIIDAIKMTEEMYILDGEVKKPTKEINTSKNAPKKKI